MKLIYESASGNRINLSQRKPFFLTHLDGVGRTRQTINTFKAPEQDGAFFISSTLDMRNITLEGTLVANTTEEAFEHRNRFLRAFTPKQRGVFYYRSKQIACIVEEAGFIHSSSLRAPNFFVSLICPSPFFEALDDLRVELATWRPKFKFLLSIPATGMAFGIREPSQIITVDNIGDVACGCVVAFRAIGRLTNPEIRNIHTGEFIRINRDMIAGEEVRVYTHFAKKRVEHVIGQTITNGFHLWDTGSTFIQLAEGRNLLRYDAETNMDSLEVSVYYRPQFLGV